MLREFIRFSRPHTIVGTTVSISALYVMALAEIDFSELSFGMFLLTLLSCLGANIFIVGLNQLTDIEIDRINKPYLPLASGAFSVTTGRAIIFASVSIALLIAAFTGWYLFWTVILSLLLGTIYSLPPIRLKRFYFWAAFCIIAVRGVIVNLLLYLHFSSELEAGAHLTGQIWFLTAVIFVYSFVIAWFKDIPDMLGDQMHSIHTLSLEFGAKKVFDIGNALLLGTLGLIIVVPLIWSSGFNAGILSAIHFMFGAAILFRRRTVDILDSASMFSYYQFIWILFFGEYLAFALSRVFS